MAACNCQFFIANSKNIQLTRKSITAGASVIIINYPVETPTGVINVPVIVTGKERYGPQKDILTLPCGHRKPTDCCGYGCAIRETFEELRINISNSWRKNNCFVHKGTFIIFTSVPVDKEKVNCLLQTDFKNSNLPEEYKEMSECEFIVIHTEETIDKFIANVNNKPYSKTDPTLGRFVKFICGFLRQKENWKKYVSCLIRDHPVINCTHNF